MNEQVVIGDGYKTFAAALDAAKFCAKEYRCDVSVIFDATCSCWNLVVSKRAEEAYSEREQAKRASAFDRECLPDPAYEEEESVRPVFGNDWSHLR